tara:strand:+ start:547 stop:693 length:147 start_codon:yes stop_codon:yes gene_type:complete
MTTHINAELYKALPIDVKPTIDPSEEITTDNLNKIKDMIPVKKIPEDM